MNIVFLGSAEFGLPALGKLIESHHVCAVVSTPAKPQGRGLKRRESPIVEFARRCGIADIFTPEDCKDPELATALSWYHADIFVVVAFRILPRSLFSIPPLGTVNIHASLLPEFRGPAPIQRAIEAGKTETGVTVFRIDEGVDTGAVLVQKTLSIGLIETMPELYARLSACGADALIEAVNGLSRGTISPLVQDHSAASGAPKLSKEEARIDWYLSAERIFNKIRAFKPFPGTYTMLKDKRIGIEWAEPLGGATSGTAAGTVVDIGKDSFDVCCASGMLRVLEVKPESRRSMNVRDFLLGNAIQKGAVLG
jgi:methionyl-tRNA formyltransferase